jgi:mono/diheme cytochrome c family protein
MLIGFAAVKNAIRTFWIRVSGSLAFMMALIQANAFAFEEDNCFTGFGLVDEVEYESDIQSIFDANCVICHQPGTTAFEQVGLDLRAGESYWNLMGQGSVQIERFLVHPLASDALLFSKLICEEPEVGERMPKGQPRLSQSDLAKLFTWRRFGSMPGFENQFSISAMPGLAGSWYEPETPGQGMVIELIALEPFTRALVYWFTFSEENESGESEQRWYLADGILGPFNGQARGLLAVHTATGGVLDNPEPPASVNRVGTAVIKFLSCDEANFAYNLAPDEGGQEARTGKISLQRLSPNENCEDDLD